MMSLADGFLDALEADFEHIAPTAFSDGRDNNPPKAKLEPVKDWATMSALSQAGVPQIPPSEFRIPKPSSRQRIKSAEKREKFIEKVRGMSPDGPRPANVGLGSLDSGSAEYSDRKGYNISGFDDVDASIDELIAGSAGRSGAGTSVSVAKEGSLSASSLALAGARSQQLQSLQAREPPPGWVYSQGWTKRPRPATHVSIDAQLISRDIAARAAVKNVARHNRPVQLGKKAAASFGKLPTLERPRPPSFASPDDHVKSDLARLRNIWVDVSRGRVPGPRYNLNPVSPRRHKPVNGKRLTQGRDLITGFAKSISGKAAAYPSVDDFANSIDLNSLSASQFDRESERLSRMSYEALNSGAVWAGRPHSGSIYEAGANTGGPGPAYDVNAGFLATAAAYRSERAQFSPINSAPGTPDQRAHKKSLDLPAGRRTPTRLSPELSIAHKPY